MGWPGSMTHRQFVVWQIWDDDQWNVMTKTDYYLAQIPAVIHRFNSRKRKQVKIVDYRIKFTKEKKAKTSIASMKSRWIKNVGGHVVRSTTPPPEGEVKGETSPPENEPDMHSKRRR